MVKIETPFVVEDLFHAKRTLENPTTPANLFCIQLGYKIDAPLARILAGELIGIQSANRRLFKTPLPLGYIMWVARRIAEGNKKSPEELLCIAYGTLDVVKKFKGSKWGGFFEVIVDHDRYEVYELSNGFLWDCYGYEKRED